MLQILLIILFLGYACFDVLLIRSFEYMSLAELKRQARKGNIQAAKIYSLRGQFGMQLWMVLWGSLGLASAAIILLLDQLTWTWLALLIDVPILILIHAIMPWSRRPKPDLGLAAACSPGLGPILRLLYPLTSRLMDLVGRWIEPEPTKTVHSKDELLEMLSHTEGDDRVSRDELKIASSALVFGDKKIGTVMIPLSVVKTVKKDDILSPVLLSELHASGFSRFPVGDGQGNFCGTLLLKDLTASRSSKAVADVMRPEVYYVNEQATLDQALKAFIKTKHHLFLVVNEFEEVVGILTIEDVLEQILGMRIVDEFDQYDDLRAMALHIAEQKRAARNAPNETVVDIQKEKS